MRLQLALLVALAAIVALTLARRARAQAMAKIDERAAVYQDTDRTTVLTQNVAARGAPAEHVGLEARYLVDMITSASVDVVTAATGAFHDVRTEIEGGADYHHDNGKLSASYIHSIEHDWESHTVNLGLSQDLARHDLTLSLGGSYVYNDVGRASDLNFHRRMDVGGANLGLTVVASPRDLFDLGYTVSYVRGYQASPYRFIFFHDGDSPLLFSEPETDPDERLRHAVTLRYNRHLFRDTALRSHLRGYADDWGIVSATLGTEYVVGFGELETSLFVRGYAQEHASFYQPEYTGPMRYMTADRELATFVDAFGGTKIGWRRARLGMFEELHAEAKLTGFYFRFFDFPRLPERSGVLGEIALGVAF